MKKILLLCLCITFTARAENTASFRLGQELMTENQPDLASVEFRRYAAETGDPANQSQAYLHAVYASLQAENPDVSKKLLRQVEATLPEEPAIPLLYSEISVRQNDPKTALYFLDMAPAAGTNDLLNIFSTRRAAELLLRTGQTDAAKQRLATAASDETAALSALDDYLNAPRKSPAVGGLLGLIPGAGYWYSGEIANGFRSLLLNSLFMFGMVQTAQDDQWGAFAVISFFEITWYSGSIYGGIDAAHRFNREQLEICVDRMNVPRIEPDRNATIPLFQLKVLF